MCRLASQLQDKRPSWAVSEHESIAVGFLEDLPLYEEHKEMVIKKKKRNHARMWLMFRSFRATNKEIIGLGNFPTANCVRKCRHSLCNANLRPSDTLKTSFVSARERDNAVTTEFLLSIHVSSVRTSSFVWTSGSVCSFLHFCCRFFCCCFSRFYVVIRY